METGEKIRPQKAPMVNSFLAALYQVAKPLLGKFHVTRIADRKPNPADVRVPEGYAVEVVAAGLNGPVHCAFDDQGACYVFESGHKIDAKPRILKVDPESGHVEVFYDWPEERWNKTGAVTGGFWHNGCLYVMNTDTLSRIHPGGRIEDLVTGLCGLGDHQANHPTLGPDGKIYFGQGSATNMGVVGADNAAFEWLPKFPHFHDVPAQDITLTGQNYPYPNVLGDVTRQVNTGAYSPFGVETVPWQVIRGDVRCTGAILRCNLDGSGLEVVAWGLRNPYGTAFSPDGRLYCTEHGSDERGQRYIVNDLDDFYEIVEGEWYGWPDFASGIRLDDPFWGKGGQGREPVLAEHPNPNPPRPRATFSPHASPNGFDFCRDERFGFPGWAFVALFGDIAPITTLHLASPVGFKVVRVHPDGRVENFAVNRYEGAASQLPHEGFERPAHCQFGPDGCLYVVDWGQVQIAIERGSIRNPLGSGVLWRIRRTAEPQGLLPPEPVRVPVYLAKAVLALLGAAALAAGGAWLYRRIRQRARRR